MAEFITVKYKHRRKQNTKIIRPVFVSYIGPSAKELCHAIKQAKCQLIATPFFQHFIRTMGLEDCCQFTEILCYGIGRIGMCHSALQQVALLLAMVEKWKPTHTWIYDPVLETDETKALETLGFESIATNEGCRRKVEVKTLVYMPHCGMAMYNNLLWANWSKEQLQQLTVIGNTFSSYSTRLTIRQFQEEAWYIYSILPYCLESPLPPTFPHPNVLNDTSVHIFPEQQLASVPSKLWSDCQQPAVDPMDPEIIL